EHLVTRLQTALGIELEGSVECRTGELTGHSQLNDIITTPTISQTACTKDSCSKCLCRWIRGIISYCLPILCHKPISVRSFIRFTHCSCYPLCRTKQSFTLLTQWSKYLFNASTDECCKA